jgi:hypothetical protein
MELYPRIFGWDVKVFTNCRMGMMFWAVGIVSFCYKSMELNYGRLDPGLAASVAIQLVYIAKFFFWEMGYMNSMDIQHDRAGYVGWCACYGNCILQGRSLSHTHIQCIYYFLKILHLLGLPCLGSFRLHEPSILLDDKRSRLECSTSHRYLLGWVHLCRHQLRCRSTAIHLPTNEWKVSHMGTHAS